MNLSVNLASYLAFAWFAWIGSVTPGPNCMVALATGANFGARATVPHALGVMIGFSAMLLAASFGVATLIQAHPLVAGLLRWLGIAYLLWLGIQLMRSRGADSRRVARPPKVYESALLQLANPKAWMLVIATAGAYQGLARPVWLQQLLIVTTFALCCSLAIFIWGWIGASMREWLTKNSRMAIFNGLAGASLIITAIWTALYV